MGRQIGGPAGHLKQPQRGVDARQIMLCLQ